jgi:hypothetical protein
VNEYINLYTGTVTKGKQDGDIVSQNDAQTSPITVSLDATNSEVKYVKCAIRTEKGYKSSRTSISFLGLTQEKWMVAKDEDFANSDEAKTKGIFEKQLVITDEINDTNTIFWLQVSSSVDEKPRRDISVSVKVDSYIVTI